MVDYEKALFNIDIAGGIAADGSLLISEPFLLDDYFRHSVIFMIEHTSKGGSMGLVLNRSTDILLHDIAPGIDDRCGIRVFCGGPMSHDRLYYLHTLGDIIRDSREVAHGLYVGGDYNDMTRYVNAGYPIDGCIRFFIGYSGWGSNQLDEELTNKVWAVRNDYSPESILRDSGDSFWHRHVKSLGPEFKGWLYHPKNPQAN